MLLYDVVAFERLPIKASDDGFFDASDCGGDQGV